MNLTQLIIKELAIFPIVTRDQLYRLCKSYNGVVSLYKFKLELDHLVKCGLVNYTNSDNKYGYSLK